LIEGDLTLVLPLALDLQRPQIVLERSLQVPFRFQGAAEVEESGGDPASRPGGLVASRLAAPASTATVPMHCEKSASRRKAASRTGSRRERARASNRRAPCESSLVRCASSIRARAVAEP